MALCRLVPIVPFAVVNYGMGLTGISLRSFALTSFVCMLPGAAAFTWLGYAGRSAAGGDLGAVKYALLGLGLLAAIAFLPRLIRRWRSRVN